MTAGPSSRSRSRRSTSAMRSRDHPDVPTTTETPASIAASTIAGLAAGWVTSSTTSAPSSSSRLDRESRPACSSRSSASSINRAARRPILPVAPATATLIVTTFTLTTGADGSARRPRLDGMLRFRDAAVTDPDSHRLLGDCLAERAAGFPPEQGEYRPTWPTTAQFTPPAGVFLLVLDDEGRAVGWRRPPHPALGRTTACASSQAPVALAGGRGRGEGAGCCKELEASRQLRRRGGRARHQREPRGGGRAVPLEQLRRHRAVQRQTRTRRTGTASGSDAGVGSDRELLRQAPYAVRAAVARGRCARGGPQGWPGALGEHGQAGRPGRRRPAPLGRAEDLADEPSDNEVVRDEEIVAVLAVRAEELGVASAICARSASNRGTTYDPEKRVGRRRLGRR